MSREVAYARETLKATAASEEIEKKQMPSNKSKKEEYYRELMSMPQKQLIANFRRALMTKNELIADKDDEIRAKHEELVRQEKEIADKDDLIAKLSAKKYKEKVQAERLLAEAKRKQSETVAAAKKTLARANAAAKKRIADSEAEAEAIKRTTLTKAAGDIRVLERKRDDEKRRALSVYDGISGQVDEQIDAFEKMLSDLKDAKRRITEMKDELRSEDFKTFDITKYISDDDDYFEDIGFEEADDVLEELVSSTRASSKRADRGVRASQQKPAKRASLEKEIPSISAPSAKKKDDAYSADDFVALDFDDFDDGNDDDDDDGISFTGTFGAIKELDDASDFGLDFEDDDDLLTVPKRGESVKERGAASRWL